MEIHEKHCTGNPERICRMCEKHEFSPQPLNNLVNIVKSFNGDQEKTINDLRTAADGCPMCMLSAIKQSKMQGHSNTPEEDGTYWSLYFDNFDFKKERDSVWEESRTEC